MTISSWSELLAIRLHTGLVVDIPHLLDADEGMGDRRVGMDAPRGVRKKRDIQSHHHGASWRRDDAPLLDSLVQ